MSKKNKKMRAVKDKIDIEHSFTEETPKALEIKSDDWSGNIFDSYLSDDIKQIMNNFLKSNHLSMCGTIDHNLDNVYLVQEMYKQLSDNISKAVENNVALGQSFLQCCTIADAIELNKKAVNCNITLSSAICFDLVHDMQNIYNNAIRNSSDYIIKNMNVPEE